MDDRRRLERVVAVGIAFVAVCFAAGGYGQARDVRALATRGVTAPATIVGLTGARHPALEVEFATADGRRVRAETAAYVEDGAPGEPVTVVYDPRDPALVRTADFGVDYTWAMLLGVLAVAGLAVAGVVWVRGVPARFRA